MLDQVISISASRELQVDRQYISLVAIWIDRFDFNDELKGRPNKGSPYGRLAVKNYPTQNVSIICRLVSLSIYISLDLYGLSVGEWVYYRNNTSLNGMVATIIVDLQQISRRWRRTLF